MSAKNKISVDGVSKGFGDLSVVDDVSFQVRAGEIVGTGNQNLAFRAQTPQSGRMNQSRAIALERGA